MNKMKKIISVLLLAVVMCSLTYSVYAEPSSSDYQRMQNQVQQDSQQTQKQLDNVEEQIDAVLQEVADLNSSILECESQIDQLKSKLDTLEKSIAQKEKELAEKKKTLENRLVAMYMKKETTFLDVVLSGNLMNFISNQDIVKQAAQYDNRLITEVEELKTSLEQEKIEVETLKSESENKQKELQNLKSQKEQKAANLTEEQKQLEAQLSEYKAQAEKYAALERQAIAKEEAARKAAQETLNKSTCGSSNSTQVTSYSGGKLGWPCPSSSRITSQYGYRILYGVKDFHTGIDIGASYGSNIVAAESGTVILASYGWNGSYGNYIIINHGNGITTRYAHASKLYVTTGQTVTKGQVIAAVGESGRAYGAHLHFEVRKNGSHTNPLNYL
ncbi:MAG: peptidoglycan DD-metalloendopeptidase family protein [Clostridia bacterium]|nr:peptidoglycan DD-metalloendopeptidase family protein [Clostridia bacterium]